MKLTKYSGNPILKPNSDNAWEERCVLNPAVVYDESRNKFVMLYRAAGNDVRHQIKLGLAESDDGVHFLRECPNKRCLPAVTKNPTAVAWKTLAL